MMLTASPWTNPIDPLDATGDGQLSARDALVILNQMNRSGTGDLHGMVEPPILGGTSSLHYDATGEGELSARDALKIVNALGKPRPEPSPTGQVPDQSGEMDAAFDLAIADDFGQTQGELVSTDDRDVFRFVATKNRVAVSLSSRALDSVATIRVLDSQAREMAGSDDGRSRQAFEGLKFTTEPQREYFIVVEHIDAAEATRPESEETAIDDGGYSIQVYQYQEADRDGDTIDSATPIFATGEGIEFTREIDFAGDVDVFRFRTPEIGPTFTYLSVGRSGDLIDTDFQVLDSQGRIVDTDSDVELASADWVVVFDVLPDQDYFIRVTAAETADGETEVGGYMLTLGLVPGTVEEKLGSGGGSDGPPADPDPGEDIHASNFDDATLLPAGQVVSNIDFDGDEDLFRIPVSGGAVNVSLAEVGMDFEVYDASRQRVVPVTSVYFGRPRIGGTYAVGDSEYVFVRVSGGSIPVGEYALLTREVEATDELINPRLDQPTGTDDLHGDIPEAATDLAVGQGVGINGVLETSDDVDVFRIPNVLRASLFVDGVHGMIVEVLDGQEQVVAPRGFYGRGDLFGFATFPEVSGDFAFIRIFSDTGGTGQYRLFVVQPSEGPSGDLTGFDPTYDFAVDRFLPDSAPGNDFHSDDFSNVRLLGKDNDVVTSWIDSAGDVDVFRITGNRNDDISVGVSSDDLANLNMEIFDTRGNALTPDRFVDQGDAVGLSLYRLSPDEFEQDGPLEFIVRISAGDDETGQYTLLKSVRLDSNGGVQKFSQETDVDNALWGYVESTRDSFGGEILGIDAHGDAVETATEIELFVPQRQLASYIDAPGDQDAFRFTALYADALFVLGEQFGVYPRGDIDLLDAEGNAIELSIESDGESYVAKSASLTVGDEYVIVVSAVSPHDFGAYHLQIQPIGDVGSLIDPATAVDVILEGKRATVTGSIEDASQLDVYRFSSRQSTLLTTLIVADDPNGQTPKGFQYQLIHAQGDGRVLSPIWNDNGFFSTRLPGSEDQESHDVYLVIWSPASMGDYEIQLQTS